MIKKCIKCGQMWFVSVQNKDADYFCPVCRAERNKKRAAKSRPKN